MFRFSVNCIECWEYWFRFVHVLRPCDFSAVANCDHGRACLLAMNFDAQPVGAFDCEQFRSAITKLTRDLFSESHVTILLKSVNQCAKANANVVVPYTPGMLSCIDFVISLQTTKQGPSVC